MAESVHFIGIYGSGCFRAALAAKAFGFSVSGCSADGETPYAAAIDSAGIPVEIGHDAAHIAGADIVAVSPALLHQSKKIAEVAAAKDAGKLTTWQDFLGGRIFPKMKCAAVAGTHGKTTTSSMLGYVLQRAGLKPMLFIGANVPQLDAGEQDTGWAVIEADEYGDNFASYRPRFIILNNLEMEHPEFFSDFEHYKSVFSDFLANAPSDGVLVYNAGDKNIPDVLGAYRGRRVPFSAADADGFALRLAGAHNVSNAAAVVKLSREIGISDDTIRNALADFAGAGHRLEKVFDDGRAAVIDDYAHHHTQAAASIAAMRGEYPGRKLVVVYEPHQISRYVRNTEETLRALAAADFAIITRFWGGREAHLDVPDAAADIERFEIKNMAYIPDLQESANAALASIGDAPAAILVMGAGQSWKIARELKEILARGEFPY
ncbi:MAG: Mur ligase domain-containing protein [Rickettsiales bacterium]|jgi:UDP-N-acetylmuramate--alanine ligase|nr:Mur ligase domain-containing protein [Rickettsiales bacterium]